MKIHDIEYTELISVGFNHVRIGAHAELDYDEKAEDGLNKLKKWVKAQLGVKDNLTYYEKCQIAREVVNKMVDETIPF